MLTSTRSFSGYRSMFADVESPTMDTRFRGAFRSCLRLRDMTGTRKSDVLGYERTKDRPRPRFDAPNDLAMRQPELSPSGMFAAQIGRLTRFRQHQHQQPSQGRPAFQVTTRTTSQVLLLSWQLVFDQRRLPTWPMIFSNSSSHSLLGVQLQRPGRPQRRQ